MASDWPRPTPTRDLAGNGPTTAPACKARSLTHVNLEAYLVVYSLSRLARSTRDAIDIAERLAKSDADLVSITEKIDTTTSMGRFFFTTIAALAQLERDQISERTCIALAHKRSKRQRVSGHIPYGSRLAADGVNLVDEPEEQRAVGDHPASPRPPAAPTREIEKELQNLAGTPTAAGLALASEESCSICADAGRSSSLRDHNRQRPVLDHLT